jgi:hypothetical protein
MLRCILPGLIISVSLISSISVQDCLVVINTRGGRAVKAGAFQQSLAERNRLSWLLLHLSPHLNKPYSY